MIKTENGNDTLTFEEFAEEVRKLVPAAEEETLREAYDQISARHIICKGGIEIASPRLAEQVLKYVKDEFRHKFKAVFVELSYDCGPMDWCPQDCPYELLLIDEERGNVMTQTGLWKWFDEQKRKRNEQRD